GPGRACPDGNAFQPGGPREGVIRPERDDRQGVEAELRRLGDPRASRGWSGDHPVKQRIPVWITGGGIATPLGHSYDAVAENLLAGRWGVRGIAGFDVAEHPSQIAGQMDEVPRPADFDAEQFADLPRLEQLILWCCTSAL